MILQALAEYYSALQKQGKVASPGRGPVKVSFALYLGEDGTLERVVSVQTEQLRGKKDCASATNDVSASACKAHRWRGCKFPLRQLKLHIRSGHQGET